MRRVGRSISTLLLLLLLASILISCQNARRNADFRDSPLVKMGYETYADGNDAIGFPYNGSSNYIAESDTGYYFLSGNFVYYMDRDRMIPVLLDQQLRENDLIRAEGLMNWSLAESTAYFANPSSLYYFGDKLYLIADESPVRGEHGTATASGSRYLFEIDPDGQNRKAVLDMADVNSLSLHRSHAYYLTI